MFLRCKLTTRLIVICVITTLVITNLILLWDIQEYRNAEHLHSMTDGVLTRSEHSEITVELSSGATQATLTIDGVVVYSSNPEETERSLHVIVLSQETGRVMATRRFDTYSPGGDGELVSFLEQLSPVGRVVCFMAVDEVSFHLRETARSKIELMGSQSINSIGWRDTWQFAARTNKNGYSKLTESHSHVDGHENWGYNLRDQFVLRFEVSLSSCVWKEDTEAVVERRSYFCERYEGYGQLCDCKHPLPIEFYPLALENRNLDHIPVAVIASNRPRYLFRMLRTLLSARGSSPGLVTVYIDGEFEEVRDVCDLLRVNYKQNLPVSSKNARITQHYKSTLVHLFDTHPRADYGIVIEEDLDIAPDFFEYFSQTIRLLEQDSSLFCVSAWNDQGYSHSSQDATLLYRVETMPGLGWMLGRKLFQEELLPQWPSPDKFWDWDMWMRTEYIRKGRECVIPDISRTFHFGQSGLNMNPYFHEIYFKNHAINTDPNVRLENVNQLISEHYEELIHNLIDKSRLLDHNKNACDPDFIPDTKGEIYTLYIKLEDNFDNWIRLARCLHLWDLDARGFHKGLWRFWLKGNHILVIGVPLSEYAGRHMPSDLSPVLIEELN